MHTNARRAAAGGFTLVEVMVVVVILGLLATMVAVNVEDSSDTARETRATADVRTIAGAVRMYYAQHGQLPALEQLTRPDARDKTFLESLPRDPWGGDYVLRTGAKPRDFEVRSAGPDRELDTADDVSSRAAS